MSVPVCACGEYGTAGCRHTNPTLIEPHRCPTPSDYKYRVQQWECGVCHRVWTPTQFGWTEVRGPVPNA